MTKLMVTAQRLSDGRVVYLGRDRRWMRHDADAWVTDDAGALDAALGWAATQTEVVVEPYRIEVDVIDGLIRHRSARERIRAEGPAAVLRRFGFGREVRVARAAVG